MNDIRNPISENKIATPRNAHFDLLKIERIDNRIELQ